MAKLSTYSLLAATAVAADDQFPVEDQSTTPAFGMKNVTAANLLQAALLLSTGFGKLASNVLSFGPNGSTNPTLKIDGATASAATGVKIVGAAAAGGVAVSVITSGTNENLAVDAAGSGTITLNGTATGNVKIGAGSSTLQFPTAGIIADANGNELVKFASTVASAINELTLTNAAAGNPFLVAATGGDTNIGIKVDGKGSGTITLNGTGTGNVITGTNLQFPTAGNLVDPNGNELITFPTTVASAVNQLKVTNSATGNPVLLAAMGGDTNTGLSLDGKGSGTINLNATGTGATVIGTQIQMPSAGVIQDAGGNELIKFPATVASAVNELTVSNAATTAAPAISATGGDTNTSVDLVPKGSGLVRARALAVQKVTQTALTESATMTIAQMLTGAIDGTPTGAASYALPTAAALVAGIPNARVGDSFSFLINNKSGGANTITVTAGGSTLYGTATVAQNKVRLFVVVVTNVTGASEAYTVYCIE